MDTRDTAKGKAGYSPPSPMLLPVPEGTTVVAESRSPALHFRLLGVCPHTGARAAQLLLPHSEVLTPVFMPVGTQGTVKGLTTSQLHDLDCRIILGNTFHLGLRPVRPTCTNVADSDCELTLIRTSAAALTPSHAVNVTVSLILARSSGAALRPPSTLMRRNSFDYALSFGSLFRYHLGQYHGPEICVCAQGTETLDQAGGLHKFMNWTGSLLTVSA